MRQEEDKMDYLIRLSHTAIDKLETGEKRLDKIESRLEKTETQLFLYKTIISILKWIAGVTGAILTLKFGDIGRYF